jgi:hypothetical protein
VTWSRVAKGAAVVALLSAPIEAGAMEIVGGSRSAGAVKDGLIAIVAQAPTGARVRGAQNKRVDRQVNRNVRVNRNAHASVNVNRNVHVDGAGHPGSGPGHPVSVQGAKAPVVQGANPPVVQGAKPPVVGDAKPPLVGGAKPPIVGGWARPDWYRWSPGGAIAAGAALGFVTAAVATWATPPQPGLCWYYTDPSQQDGFWDACP